MGNAQVGDILDDRYRLDAQIAKGGMSTVFRGQDLRLGRSVAVKVMDDRYADDPVFSRRFVREAQSMAQLHHPNIVDVFDFNSTADSAYLVMELIEGGTLRELLAERGPMPPHAAAQVMRGLLTGLSVAHHQGLIHRDIKPDNVLIDKDHRIKLTDFGLVRAASESERTTDNIVGTVSYLAPEQVNGQPLSPSSDVYSAGVLLFEVLTGTTPFAGETQVSHAMQRLTSDVPAPSSRIEGVPQLFDELVAAATHRAPEERFPSASEFLAALEDIATELRLPAFKVPVPANTALARATTAIAAPLGDSSLDSTATLLPTTAAPHSTSILWEEPATSTLPANETSAFPAAEPFQPLHQPPYNPPAAPPTPAPLPEVQFEDSPPLSNRSGVKLVAWLLVVAVLLTAVAIGGWWFGSGRYGEVPQILGMDETTAVKTVTDAGFVATARPAFSDDIAVGKAVGTEPPFGSRVPRSTEIEVLVSKGQPTVPAVGIRGDIAEYRQMLSDRTLHLEIGTDAYSDSIPMGGIAEVSPAAGVTVRTGSTVTAKISKGPAPIEVPDVSGLSLAAAKEILSKAGLTVGTVEEGFSDRRKAGEVISSQPGAASKLARGSEVKLKVSNAIEVPDVKGMSWSEASNKLSELGVTVEKQSTGEAGLVADEVVGMSEKPGALMDPNNARITIRVASKVKVASVIGLSRDEAVRKLQEQGLDVALRREGAIVMVQSPRAGSKVDAGSTVELTAL